MHQDSKPKLWFEWTTGDLFWFSETGMTKKSSLQDQSRKISTYFFIKELLNDFLQIWIAAKYVIDVCKYLLPSGEGVLEQGHSCQSQKTARKAINSTHKHHRKEPQKLPRITNCLAESKALINCQTRFHKSIKIAHQRRKSPKQTKTHVQHCTQLCQTSTSRSAAFARSDRLAPLLPLQLG